MKAYCAKCNDDVDYTETRITESATIRNVPITLDVDVMICPECGHVRDIPGQPCALERFYKEYEALTGQKILNST